ncbi:hypothetical protein V1514DRAFT_298752 [Lipomyces japonicus]|uniref:uncharacterized protein n=1 Tax=Lipomyces japonicus TaxID=56871 RepID=UPI0034CEB255
MAIETNTQSSAGPVTGSNSAIDPKYAELESLLVGKDRERIQMNDADFKRLSWDDLKQIVETNRLDLLMRLPSDILKYLVWKKDTIAKYGSVANYVLEQKLQWGEGTPGPKSLDLFAEKSDYKILLNDFPYGLEDSIIHIVVWSKVIIPKQNFKAHDGTTIDDLPNETRIAINNFVDQNFAQPLGLNISDILWFKNWTALQSIREIDHFHVLLRKPPLDQRIFDLLREDVDVAIKLGQVDSRF